MLLYNSRIDYSSNIVRSYRRNYYIYMVCSRQTRTIFNMEKAILSTLIYADIFDYSLKIYEIHKWLVGRKVTLRQAEKTLKKLNYELRIMNKGEYYFLKRRESVVLKRQRKEKQSAIYFRKAKILCQILKIIPFVKLVGISGGLAMENAGKSDDIDLFIITAKDRMWISRLFILGLLSLTGQRRKRTDQGRKIAGKICINILLAEDKLEQSNKDIFTAHEVLQMRVLWQRNGIYSKYLSDNSWAFKFLPNWVSNVLPSPFSLSSPHRRGSNSERELVKWIPAFAGMTMENIAKWLQLKIMQRPLGMERINDGALYFHPKDCRLEVLQKYNQKVKKLLFEHRENIP